jgi:hypothetical protein
MGDPMMDSDHNHSALAQLVGGWHGTLLYRSEAERPFQQLPCTSENRWVLGGRFVEMTLRAGASGDTWSALFYIGYERNERRHVLVSLEPGDRRITTRLGDWTLEQDRLVLTSQQSRTVCDMTIPGQLTLELKEEPAAGAAFVRFKAEYHTTAAPVIVRPALPREHRRFVIA